MGTGSFPGVKYGRSMVLTTHPLLAPWSWKSRAIPLPTLWAKTRPVTGALYLYLYIYSSDIWGYCGGNSGCDAVFGRSVLRFQRNLKLQSVDIIKIQRDATVCRCLFTAKLSYMFRVPIAPIIRSISNCNCSLIISTDWSFKFLWNLSTDLPNTASHLINIQSRRSEPST